MSSLGDVEVELGRVVDRLNSMPLAKAESARDDAYATAAFIVEQSRLLDDSMPQDAELPHVGVSACGAQLAVVGDDYLRIARRKPDLDASEVVDALVTLRRALP